MSDPSRYFFCGMRRAALFSALAPRSVVRAALRRAIAPEAVAAAAATVAAVAMPELLIIRLVFCAVA